MNSKSTSQSSTSKFSQEAIRVDRTELKVLTFEEAEREDRAYWHGKSPIERLRHQELLRQMNYGSEVINQGFQRILGVFERSGS